MQYAWFIWSLILLFIWVVVYFSLRDKKSRKEMLTVSFWTSLLGLSEPLFVPEYWNPPSLFDLAQRTGFDIESIIFAFAIGGLAVVMYERIFKTEHIGISHLKKQTRHRYHLISLISAPVIFFGFILLTELNPIYSAIIALLGGGIFTLLCRPDLKKKMIISALLFTGFYFLYFLSLIAVFPDYVGLIWNFTVISGILILGIPLEELVFAFGAGFLWPSIYEHITWKKIMK